MPGVCVDPQRLYRHKGFALADPHRFVYVLGYILNVLCCCGRHIRLPIFSAIFVSRCRGRRPAAPVLDAVNKQPFRYLSDRENRTHHECYRIYSSHGGSTSFAYRTFSAFATYSSGICPISLNKSSKRASRSLSMYKVVGLEDASNPQRSYTCFTCDDACSMNTQN